MKQIIVIHNIYAHLGNESDKLPEVLCLLVRVNVKDLTDAVVVVPLLEELFLVCRRVSLDEILKLWEVRGEEDAATHGGKLEGLESCPQKSRLQHFRRTWRVRSDRELKLSQVLGSGTPAVHADAGHRKHPQPQLLSPVVVS